jgi:hypothetical protein
MSDELNLIPENDITYNQRIRGFYGELGSARNVQIFYLQCGIRPEELSRVTLVSEIPGSECWSVRDLFQREVDTDRVTHSILPYLHNRDQIKFFNPLTLTVLSIDPSNSEVEKQVPILKAKTVTEGKNEWTVLESENMYRFMHLAKAPHIGRVEWDDSRVKVVAIDGQHRLSALKRLYDDMLAVAPNGQADFKHWTIPVIIFGIRGLDENEHRPTVLEVVRNIFIYINTAARSPNRARRILLSDESINSICAQELLEHSHNNDVKEPAKRDPARLPLLFYDWRGEEKGERRVPAPACIKTIEEIHDWFSSYICGLDFEQQQATSLGVQPTDKLNSVFSKKKLSALEAPLVRKRFKETILPGLCYFLEQFIPYKDYVGKLRKLEDDFMAQSDLARHAFYQLRFGSNRASNDKQIQQDIAGLYEKIVDEVIALKQEIPELLGLDIGMRGLVYAYAELWKRYSTFKGKTVLWLDFTKWFTELANEVYAEGWFHENNNKLKAHLKHIARDHYDGVVNYRLEDAESGLGGLMVIIICARGYAKGKIPKESHFQTIWELFSELLTPTLIKGYRKELRPGLKEKYPEEGPKLKEALRKEADAKTEKHLKKLREYCEYLAS